MATRTLLLMLGVLLTAFVPTHAHAQNSERFGVYEVHYNALVTGMLGADMARQYGITRSNRGGMLNIAVHKTADDGSSVAVPATLSAEAINLTGQKSPVTVREIAGPDISYIGLFDVNGPDTFNFHDFDQAGKARRRHSHTLRFSQNFVGG